MEAVDCLEDSSGRDNIKPRGDGTGDLAHPAYYAGSGFDADGPRYYTQTGAMSGTSSFGLRWTRMCLASRTSYSWENHGRVSDDLMTWLQRLTVRQMYGVREQSTRQHNRCSSYSEL